MFLIFKIKFNLFLFFVLFCPIYTDYLITDEVFTIKNDIALVNDGNIDLNETNSNEFDVIKKLNQFSTVGDNIGPFEENPEELTTTFDFNEDGSIFNEKKNSEKFLNVLPKPFLDYTKTEKKNTVEDCLPVKINPGDVDNKNLIQIEFDSKSFDKKRWVNHYCDNFILLVVELINLDYNMNISYKNVLILSSSPFSCDNRVFLNFAVNSSQGILSGSKVYKTLVNSKGYIYDFFDNFKIIKMDYGVRAMVVDSQNQNQKAFLSFFNLILISIICLLTFVLIILLFSRKGKTFNVNKSNKQQSLNAGPKNLSEIDVNQEALILKEEGVHFRDFHIKIGEWVKPFNDSVSNSAYYKPTSTTVTDTRM